MSDDHPELEAGAKPFLDHLEDLRVCLIRVALALIVGMLIAAPMVPKTLELLRRPMDRILAERPPTIVPGSGAMKNARVGLATLDKTGSAEVELPEDAGLATNVVFQLTALHQANDGLHISQGIVSNRFVIAGQPNSDVSWMVGDAGAEPTEIPFDPDTFLIVPEAMGGIGLAVKAAFWSGLLIASPFITFFIGAFIFPGLLKQEKRVLFACSGIAVFLSAFGVWLGYTYCIEYAFSFVFMLEEWMGIQREFMYITSYNTVVIRLLIAFGISFELPLLLYALGVLGLVRTKMLRHYRRHVFVGILTLSMILTPTDPFSMVIMAVPLYVFFEITMLLLRIREKRDPDYNEDEDEDDFEETGEESKKTT
jgi:sec-independent protein translocase protein TatC